MFAEYSYPIICTVSFAKTINFYEDHFEFLVAYETESFAILKRKNASSIYLAVMDTEHAPVPEHYHRHAGGMILNFPVHDVEQAYKELYWEGLTILGEPSVSESSGRKHFFVEDPNGILINIAQNVPIGVLSAQKDSVEIEFRR